MLRVISRALNSRALSTSSEAVMVVSAEAAEMASQRATGMLRVAPALAAALAAAAGGGGDTNRKALRRRGAALTSSLKRMSRSRHRGGVQPNLRDDEAGAPPRARGKWRQGHAAALAALARLPAVAVAAGGGGEAPDLDALGLDELQGALPARPGPGGGAGCGGPGGAAAGGAAALYPDAGAAAAYAATRLPACYAALTRALADVRAASPAGWAPAAALDFGAGPGTAAWAAARVWPERPLDVAAVEPAPAMAALGQAVLEAARAAEARGEGAPGVAADGGEGEGGGGGEAAAPPHPVPRVRWSARLPPRRGAAAPRFPLVVAAYVLGELPGDAARRRLVADLWARVEPPGEGRPGGVLVLIEPGTPSGSARVLAARAAVLGAAAGGAHVAAPCPHDGACPLEGRRAWCHFGQRLARTAAQRDARRGGGAAAPRTYQDERFSYVALRRGPRPPRPPRVAVAGAYRALGAEPQEYLHVPAGLRPRRLPPAVEGQGLLSSDDGDDGSENSEEWESSEAEDEEAVDSAAPAPAAAADDGAGGGAAAALAASAAWSRLVRPPRKRSGHVVLDLCSADDVALGGGAAGGAAAPPDGLLVRQVVTRAAARRGAGGLAPYRLARRLRWGDVWPAHFQAALPSAEPPEVGAAEGDLV